jgi:hypothetical protein
MDPAAPRTAARAAGRLLIAPGPAATIGRVDAKLRPRMVGVNGVIQLNAMLDRAGEHELVALVVDG